MREVKRLFTKIKTTLKARVDLVVIIVFFIYPLAAMPFILIEIYNRKTYSFVLLSLFMGLCAILFPPFADLYRHTQDYFEFANKPSGNLFIATKGLDFVLYSISHLFASLGIHFEMVRFLFTFFCYYIAFWIFQDIVKSNKILQEESKYYFIAFFCVFLAIPFIWIVNGLRYMLAAMLVVLSIYQVFFKNSKIGYLWSLLAFFIHFGVCILIGLQLLFGIFNRIQLNGKYTIALAVFLLLFSSPLLIALLNVMPIDESLKRIANIYIKNTASFSQSRSLFGLIANMMERASLPLLVLSLFVEKVKTPYTSLFFAFIILMGFTAPFLVLFDRLTLALIPLFLFGVIHLFEMTKFKTALVQLLLFGFLVTNCTYLYGYRAPLLEGRTNELLYRSFPSILISNYDHWWIREHLDSNGEFR